MSVPTIITHFSKTRTITWNETTEARYMEMLCVLPPEFTNADGFLVGEPSDHRGPGGAPRFAAFRHAGGGHYESAEPLTLADFRRATEGQLQPA